MKKVLISACLMGKDVKYSGGNNKTEHPFLESLHAKGLLEPICPEEVGGLPTPRDPSEIEPGFSGADVLAGRAKVVSNQGVDVTKAFVEGAEIASKVKDVAMAILKAGSPSCGNKEIYDGTHSGVKKEGEGVAAARLRQQGIAIFNEDELDDAQAYWEAL